MDFYTYDADIILEREDKMKRFTSCLLIAVMLIALIPFSAVTVSAEVWDGSVASGFASGKGTENDPYIIMTAAQLAFLAEKVTNGNKYYEMFFELGADIVINDTSRTDWMNDAKKFSPIGNSSYSFRGFFNGKKHTISGLYINSKLSCVGLFGKTIDGGIENVIIENAYISGGDCVGGIVGDCGDVIIENCSFSGTVVGNGDKVGGIVGEGDVYIPVKNCTSAGSVTGQGYVGGIGGGSYFNATECSNSARVSGTHHVGGVVGGGGTVTKCSNTGYVTGTGFYAAGIAGYAQVTENCVNFGDVNGIDDVCGISPRGTVSNCENNGYIVGDYSVAGIVSGGDATNCINTGDVKAKSSTGNCAGITCSGNAYQCKNSGNISSLGDCTGGIVGRMFENKVVAQCYNTGDVTGGMYTGGIAGWFNGTISDCYTIGDISGGRYTGGLAGLAYGVASAARCYVMGYISGYGIFGDAGKDAKMNYCYNGTSSSPVYSDIQMQTQSTFKTFDFDTVWTMEGNENYPYPELRVFAKPNYMLGDVNDDGAIDQFDYILVKRHYFETRLLTDDELPRADVNQDSVIDQFDYILIKRHYFGTFVIGG